MAFYVVARQLPPVQVNPSQTLLGAVLLNDGWDRHFLHSSISFPGVRYRQGNVFNVQDEPSGNRYGDIFFIEPGSVEANRIRDQLEKDEKDLPSYDEVMRMCNLTTPTAAAAGTPQSPLGEVPAPIGIAALPAPPYSETDPQAATVAGGATVIAMEPVEPSTSRAAQIAPSSGGCGPPAPPPTAV
ncbi:uncharacterized protein LOC108144696 isoform X8 [Drosophila elegans]|uniref:uncharacterized protein LOC108144696 isoform X8 n=1 Tax=Drosophila elegans TaxID=30023 RepID=UPI001BC84546|nr:uncharacterized protein LOC108144696 isoform X8 [Drosophila elegans]